MTTTSSKVEASGTTISSAVNQAEGYGVTVVRCVPPAAGVWYECVEVRHLTPAQNRGNHHVYVDVVDAAGARVGGLAVAAWWGTNAGSRSVLDKPAGEPMGNVPMYKNVVYGVWVGPGDRPFSEWVCDAVTGLHIMHPDEPPEDGTDGEPVRGNTWGHHSFYVRFLARVATSGKPPADPPDVPGDGTGNPSPGPPIPAEGGTASYWGWYEHTFGGLHVALYRLHALTLARPELAPAAAAGVERLRGELGGA